MSQLEIIHGKYVIVSPDQLQKYESSGRFHSVLYCLNEGNIFDFQSKLQLSVYSVPSLTETEIPSPLNELKIYKAFESAVLNLPTPILLTGDSLDFVSAALLSFLSVHHSISLEQAHKIAHNSGESRDYQQNEKLLLWVNTVTEHYYHKNSLIFRQFFEPTSSTYTYLLADAKTKEAILIDPVLETVDRDLQQIRDLGLTLKYGLNTHVHADHITGTGQLKQKSGTCLSVISELAGAVADIHLKEFECVEFGSWKLYAVATPGHTEGCTSFILDDLSRVFTGDTVLIRGCGRTDFQGGSPETLYDSVHKKLFRWLPDHCKILPAHDYKGLTESSIGEEKRLNLRLTKSKEEFITIMNNLNLPKPKKIDEAVPANRVCGIF